MLTNRGRKVQCHWCGNFFRNLGLHAVQAHDLSHGAYCMAFGLKLKTALASDDLVRHMRAVNGQRMARLGKRDREPGENRASERGKEYAEKLAYAHRQRGARIVRDCSVCGRAVSMRASSVRVTCCAAACVSESISRAKSGARRNERGQYALDEG